MCLIDLQIGTFHSEDTQKMVEKYNAQISIHNGYDLDKLPCKSSAIGEITALEEVTITEAAQKAIEIGEEFGIDRGDGWLSMKREWLDFEDDTERESFYIPCGLYLIYVEIRQTIAYQPL